MFSRVLGHRLIHRYPQHCLEKRRARLAIPQNHPPSISTPKGSKFNWNTRSFRCLHSFARPVIKIAPRVWTSSSFEFDGRLQVLYDFRGVSSNYDIWWHVLCHHGSCAHRDLVVGFEQSEATHTPKSSAKCVPELTPSPIVTPGRMIAPPPTHTSFPICVV